MDELLMWITEYITTGYFDDYIFEIIKKLSDKEKIKLFSDENVLKKLETIVDYEYMARLFSKMPSEVQEKIWNYIHCQKILLGIDACSNQILVKMIDNGKISNYYAQNQKQTFVLFLSSVNSPEILKNLPYNPYFQIFILLSGEIPESFYQKVDVELTFQQIIASDIYRLLDNKTKRIWIKKINYNYHQVLLPTNREDIFNPTQTYSNFFWGEQSDTIAAMLNTKIDKLYQKGLKLEIDYDTFKSLNIYEINVLVSDKTGTVNQTIINEYLGELVDEWLNNGSIYDGVHLDTTYLSSTLHSTIFKMFIERTFNKSEYESKALAYIFSILFPNTKDKYSGEEKKKLKQLLKNAIVNVDYNEIVNLFANVSDLKSAFFLRFELATEYDVHLNGIAVEQLIKINVKHINKIFVLLSKLKEFEGVAIFKALAIKMYLVFGLDKSIELLSGNYPVNELFLEIVNKLDVSSVKFKLDGKKYSPVIHEEFYRFLFKDGYINLLFDKDSILLKMWYYFYNNFSEIKKICNGKIKREKLGQILAGRLADNDESLFYAGECTANSPIANIMSKIPPNCWQLASVLSKILLDSIVINADNDFEAILKIISDTRNSQIKRVNTTIPCVNCKLSNGWSYGIASNDSIEVYEVGMRKNDCFKINGIGHNHLLHALLSINGGILFIYNPEGIIASYSPLKRNGELLIANSIEIVPDFYEAEEIIIDVFNESIRHICQISKECEDEHYLKVVTIGATAKYKPDGIPWPDNIPTPTILEKSVPKYKNTDSYHAQLLVIHSAGDIDLLKIWYGQVEPIYLPPRKEVLFCVNDGTKLLLQSKMLRMIEGVRYTNWIETGNNKDEFESLFLIGSEILYCNTDWFVIVKYDGSIYFECLEYDVRARREMEIVLSDLKNNPSPQTIGVLKSLPLTPVSISN